MYNVARRMVLAAAVVWSVTVAWYATLAGETPSESGSSPRSGAPAADQSFDPTKCFDDVWNTIKERFCDPDFNGVDWDAARTKYRPLALAATDHEALAAVINQMLGELKTSHTHYYTCWDPDYYTLQAVLIGQSPAAKTSSWNGPRRRSYDGLSQSDERTLQENRAMICVIATIETAAGLRDDLLDVFRELVPKVRAEPGCIEYTPMIDTPSGLNAQGALRVNVVAVVEKWESLAALTAHLATPHMAEFRRQTEHLRLSMRLQVLQPA